MSILQRNYLTRGFWGDEAWTALISRLSIPEIIKVTGQDFHPPLYYLLVHLFMQVFGESEWIRLISTFFFLLALWPTYKLARTMANQVVAVATTLLVAVSPILFVYAFEARSYALLTFLSVMSTFCFWQAVSTKQLKWWLGYGLVAVLGVYTHYYFWFILASHGVYWLLFDRRQFRRVFLVYLTVVLSLVPWLPTLFSQVKSVAGSYWIGSMNTRTHWEYFMRVVAGDTYTPYQETVGRIMLGLVVVGTVAMVISVSRQKSKKKRVLPPGYLLLWCWLIVPVLIPSLLSLFRPVFFYRYLVFTSVPILMLTVWGLSTIKKELVYVLVVLLGFVSLKTSALIFSRYPQTMREELDTVFAGSSQRLETKLYTVLPSFAEVFYYTHDRAEVVVRPEGLIQFSGQSLLTRYAERGEVTIAEPEAGESYWLAEPGPKSQFVKDGIKPAN